MDSDRQNIKWVPLMEQIPSRPTFRGTCHEVRPSHAGSWTITLRQTASGTADTCRVRFACFLQTYQFSPSATSIHSNNYCKALRGPLQHAPSAVPAPCIGHRSVMHQQGGPSGMPRDNASYGGTVLPALPQRMLSSRFPYIYHMAGSLPERVPDAASCPLRGSLPDNQKGQGAFCEHFPSPS